MERSSIPQHDDYDVTDFITVFSVLDDSVKLTEPLWLGWEQMQMKWYMWCWILIVFPYSWSRMGQQMTKYLWPFPSMNLICIKHDGSWSVYYLFKVINLCSGGQSSPLVSFILTSFHTITDNEYRPVYNVYYKVHINKKLMHCIISTPCKQARRCFFCCHHRPLANWQLCKLATQMLSTCVNSYRALHVFLFFIEYGYSVLIKSVGPKVEEC